MRLFALVSVFAIIAGAALAILRLPSDVDHALATTPEMLVEHADQPGIGSLDGLRFDTTMGPPGGKRLQDFVQFDRGLFMSQECEDRCNYPPSAYLTRRTEAGTEFFVEAYCPTKSTSMIWRGLVTENDVSGTVEWSTRRLFWSHEARLEFEGSLSPERADLSFT